MTTSNRYNTPDSVPSGTVCVRIEIPDDAEFQAIFRGALLPLVDSDSYTQAGSLTPEETAAAFEALLSQWMAFEIVDC